MGLQRVYSIGLKGFRVYGIGLQGLGFWVYHIGLKGLGFRATFSNSMFVLLLAVLLMGFVVGGARARTLVLTSTFSPFRCLGGGGVSSDTQNCILS